MAVTKKPLDLTLYSIEDVHALFPAKSIDVKRLKEMIVASRCCRDLGNGSVFMTETDVHRFVASLSPSAKEDVEPPPNEVGLLVAIGSPTDRDEVVLLRWTPLGGELDLLDRVRECSALKEVILATITMTFASAKTLLKEFTADQKWVGGHRYSSSVMGRIHELDKEQWNEQAVDHQEV
jgi:hypothetical protein